jgi:DHA2 family multidrug resistance protein
MMQTESTNIITNTAATLTPAKRWLITIAVMLATLMQVLDTTIVNVALPHMQGSLGATPDQISWTLTVYLVASGVFMPLTGYFSDFFGRKKYLLLCIAGFTLVSAFCGLSQNLSQIVFFRILQGIFGAGLVPLSQAILSDVYPKEEIGKAMAIWGAGIMVGPVLGPTLGGYITEVLDWRWTFYINVPFGIVALLMAWRVVPDTLKKIRRMDWMGLLFLAMAVGSFQYLLDRGNQLDWFNSANIKIAAFFIVFGLIGFLKYSLQNKDKTVFDLRIFKDLNFTIASVLLIIVSVGLYGGMVMQPLILENLFNYPVLTTGLVMAPRGISGMISMMLVSKLIKHVSPRLLIIIGIFFSVIGLYPCTHYSLNIDEWWFI